MYILLFIIAFIIGASIDFKEFKKVFIYPKNLIIGLVLQIFLPPILVIGIIFQLPIPESVKISFLILSICPGGQSSNLISYIFNCNIALSASLTSINTLIIPFSIPFVTYIFINDVFQTGYNLELSYPMLAMKISTYSIIPMFLGVLISKKIPSIDFKKKFIKILVGFLFFLTIFFKSYQEIDTHFSSRELLVIALIIIVYNVLLTLFGYFSISNSKIDARTIAVEVNLQNTPLAFIIVNVIGSSPIPIALYFFVSSITPIIFLLITRKRAQ